MDEQKSLLRKLLEEAWRGIIGNAAWYILLLVLGLIGTLLVVIRSWVLGTAIPVVLGALSTKVGLTVGIIILITHEAAPYQSSGKHSFKREVCMDDQKYIYQYPHS